MNTIEIVITLIVVAYMGRLVWSIVKLHTEMSLRSMQMLGSAIEAQGELIDSDEFSDETFKYLGKCTDEWYALRKRMLIQLSILLSLPFLAITYILITHSLL